MIAVDTNLLVYAHRADSEWHSMAVDCIRMLAEQHHPWAIPWPCIHEFLAVVTHPKIYAPPSTIEQALGQVEAWMESPSLNMLGEASDHWDQLKFNVRAGKIVGGMIHDARIATLCISHRVEELLTSDRDFSKFRSIRTRNPLAG